MTLKFRIILFAICAIALSALHSTLSPVSVIARNVATTATVNGDDAAFVAQNAVDQTVAFPWHFATLVVLFVLFFTKPIRQAFSA